MPRLVGSTRKGRSAYQTRSAYLHPFQRYEVQIHK